MARPCELYNCPGAKYCNMRHGADCKKNIELGTTDYLSSTPVTKKFLRDIVVSRETYPLLQAFFNRQATNNLTFEELMEDTQRN